MNNWSRIPKEFRGDLKGIDPDRTWVFYGNKSALRDRAKKSPALDDNELNYIEEICREIKDHNGQELTAYLTRIARDDNIAFLSLLFPRDIDMDIFVSGTRLYNQYHIPINHNAELSYQLVRKYYGKEIAVQAWNFANPHLPYRDDHQINKNFWNRFIELMVQEENHDELIAGIFDNTLSHTKDKVKTLGVDFDKLGKKVKLERGKHFRFFDLSTWRTPRIRTSYKGSVLRRFLGLFEPKRETSFDYKKTLKKNRTDLKAQIFAILDNDRQISSIENCLRYNEEKKQLLLMATERNCVDDRVHNGILRSFLGEYQFDRLTPTESKLMTLLSFCLSVLDANDQITDQGTIKSRTDKDFKDLTGIANEMKGLLTGEDDTTITEMTIEKFKEKMNNCEALGDEVGYEQIKAQEKKILGDDINSKVYSMFYQLRHEIDDIRTAYDLGDARTTFDTLFPIIDANSYANNEQYIWYIKMRKQLIYKRGIDKGIIYTEKDDKDGPLDIGSDAKIIHAVLKSDDTFPGQEVTYVKNDEGKWTLGEVNDDEEWVAGDVIELPTEDFEFYTTGEEINTTKPGVAETLRNAFQNSAISGHVKDKKRKHNLHFMIDVEQPEQHQNRHPPLELEPQQSRINPKPLQSCLRNDNPDKPNDNPDKPKEKRCVQFTLPKKT